MRVDVFGGREETLIGKVTVRAIWLSNPAACSESTVLLIMLDCPVDIMLCHFTSQGNFALENNFTGIY